ncbi:helix-turn-helix domain-containing protein [Virgibacillus kekensis]|uniref:Helix-turn-helix domain-containing protein n=1 Tax=Virgibacillus kekensis TaxID=202261 RepID=A0ABV9DGG3_9BACI
MEGFGRRLENEREIKGYTKRGGSKILGFSENVFGTYEREEASHSLDTLQKVSKLFDVSIDYLITGKEFSPNAGRAVSYQSFKEVLNVFHKYNIKDSYILKKNDWRLLEKEEVIELSKHFDWVAHKAKNK